MKIHLREMTPSDHEAVFALARTLAAWWQPIDQMTLAMDVREHYGMVAEDENGEMVSFLTYRLEKSDVAELTWLGVRAELRSQRIGSIMLDWLETTMAEKGIDAIELSTVPPDHEETFAPTFAFYKQRGYRIMRRENHFYAFGRPRVLLRKDLIPL
jgi:ribosomal protein S18 acetylase RimI-like enzyme